ncbi:MAG: hypothetical protein SNG81_05845 [Rikenellaceae bacterium]
MKRYLYIILIVVSSLWVACSKFDEDIVPNGDFDDFDQSNSNVVYFEDGQVGVYLNLSPQTTEDITVTRSVATGTETVIQDGWAFVFGPAKPTQFDETNVDGYGHSSELLQLTKITINANNVAFFRFDQYPWVTEAGKLDAIKYNAIIGMLYYVDDNGSPICTDGKTNFYYNEVSDCYVEHVYDEKGNEIESSGGETYYVVIPDPDSDGGIDVDGENLTYGAYIPEGLNLIYCHTDDNEHYGFYVLPKYIKDGVFCDPDDNYTELVHTLLDDFDENGDCEYSVKYEYEENIVDPFVGINHMCFLRFMVNLTEGTTSEVQALVSKRMINSGVDMDGNSTDYSGVSATVFEDYKHLSVGLDAYYGVNIDETDGGVAESPTPQSDGHANLLASKYPMASPGIEMLNGLNEYTLYGINSEDAISLVQVGSKVDVTSTDPDFTLIGVTLLNGAKRALMRSTVLDNTGTTELISLPLPTNLHYRYGDSANDASYSRVGSIQYNEVLAPDFQSTVAYPIYFFPNEGDDISDEYAESIYDYSLEEGYTLNEDFVNISDKENGFNPTYLIIRGFIAKYHDRDGDGLYDPVSATGGQIDDWGYYKVPIKYLNSETTYTYDIMRCNYFQVLLNSVNNAGYKTFEEAVAGPASDMNYDIVIGGGSDPRNEYATSNGTFYVETDVNDFYIMGYGKEGFSEATFNVRVVDNDDYEKLTADDLLTLSTTTKGALYATPKLYLTVPAGVYVLQFGDAKVEAPTSSTANTNVYEFDAESGVQYEVTLKVTSEGNSSSTALEGMIAVQAGDVCQQINIHYDDLGYLSIGDYSYVGSGDTDNSSQAGDYVRNDTLTEEDGQNVHNLVDGFNVHGNVVFTECNALIYDEEFYNSAEYAARYDGYIEDIDDAIAFGKFISKDGYIGCNRYVFTGFYLDRECRATIYRSKGEGIAKVYINQASDFGLLINDGKEAYKNAASQYDVGYTSRGYINTLSYSDDGYLSDGVEVGSNTPMQFFVAGDVSETDMVVVNTVNTYGTNSILYDDYGTNFCSGGLPYGIEEGDDVDNSRYMIYSSDVDIDNRSEIEATALNTEIVSWNEAEPGNIFNVWAYPILRNQGTDFDYGDGSSWSYDGDIESSYLDDTVVVTLTNLAGETKKYTFNLTQYSLPFWDPTLTINDSAKSFSYLCCNYPVDLYSSNNADSHYHTKCIGAVTVYNCNYNNGVDYSWGGSGYYSDVFNASNVSGHANVQAYDAKEPEYVVFAVFGNSTETSSLTTVGRDYFILRMTNAAGEETKMAVRIERYDGYIEAEGGNGYFPFNPTEGYWLDYLKETDYLNSINKTGASQIPTQYDTYY